MMAAGVGPGDEVITPTFSFFATAGCVARLGARPVLVDSDPEDLQPRRRGGEAGDHHEDQGDPAGAPVRPGGGHDGPGRRRRRRARSSRTRLRRSAPATATEAGRRARPGRLLLVLSDQEPRRLRRCRPGDDQRRRDGGAMRLLRDHGMSPRYYHAVVGGNFRLDAIQAAVLRVKLPHLDALARRPAAQRRALPPALRRRPSCSTSSQLPYERPDGSYHIYNQFVVEVPERDALRQYLTEQKIGTEIYYPVPFHRQECFQVPRLQGRRLPGRRSRGRPGARPVRSIPSCPRRTRRASSRRSAAFYRR